MAVTQVPQTLDLPKEIVTKSGVKFFHDGKELRPRGTEPVPETPKVVGWFFKMPDGRLFYCEPPHHDHPEDVRKEPIGWETSHCSDGPCDFEIHDHAPYWVKIGGTGTPPCPIIELVAVMVEVQEEDVRPPRTQGRYMLASEGFTCCDSLE